jgi:16S rRNA (guanine966-N2)-methyltransferase
LRIVGGRNKGRSLKAPKGQATRPTSDRARESVFNILNARLEGGFEGLTVVDLFAGTGAYGLEALSRGAAQPALKSLLENHWLAEKAICIVEMSAKELIELPDLFEQIDQRKYGKAVIHILRYSG